MEREFCAARLNKRGCVSRPRGGGLRALLAGAYEARII
jgi:hypothetical protein